MAEGQPEELVIVRRFSSPHEAHLARTKLESEGIPVFVHDEHVVRLNWLYSGLVGGVKLAVAQSDAQRADAVLAESDLPGRASESTERCPRCSSPEVTFGAYGKKVTFLTWLLVSFPLWHGKRRWFCAACRHRWD